METRPSTKSSDNTLIDTAQEKSKIQNRCLSPTYDEAFKFLQVANANRAYQMNEVVRLKRIGKKVDYKVLPIFFTCLLVQSLEHFAHQNASKSHLPEDLAMTSSDYSTTITVLDTGCLFGSIISAIALLHLPPATFLGTNFLLWGVATGCVSITQTYTTLRLCRVFMGVLSAATIPCFTLITSQWYSRKDQSLRFCLWGSAIAGAQLIGPFVDLAFQQIKSEAFAGWRILYVSLGGIGIVVGTWTLCRLPNTPMGATGRFLSTRETTALLNYVSSNRTTIKNTTLMPSQLKDLMKDPQIYILAILTSLISLAQSNNESTLTNIIQPPSLQPAISALLSSIPGFTALLLTLFLGFLLQYTSIPRSLSILTILTASTIGAIIILTLTTSPTTTNNTSKSPLPIAILATTLINLTTSTIPIITSLAAANIAGSTKRIISICLISSALPLGNLISHLPRLLQTNHNPATTILTLASLSLSLLLSLILYLHYHFQNVHARTKARRSNHEHPTTAKLKLGDEWLDLTDRDDSNIEFRYVT